MIIHGIQLFLDIEIYRKSRTDISSCCVALYVRVSIELDVSILKQLGKSSSKLNMHVNGKFASQIHQRCM